MTDKEYSGLSKEEIAARFMLPERKSKIATLLRQEDRAREAYCICRSSDSSRFMIGCDNCEEWYHGDCINISEKDAKYIKQYFCLRCQEEDMSLKIRYKPPKKEKDPSVVVPKHLDDRKQRKKRERTSETHESRGGSSKALRGCGECVNCYQKEDCGRCEFCKDMRKFGGTSKLKQKCRQRQCLSHSAVAASGTTRRRKRDSDSEGEMPAVNSRLMGKAARQCYGPLCTQQARQGSKYCSDQCGLKLATNRIYQVLPQRIQEWNLSPCVAEERNQRALENVRKLQIDVRNVLQELDKRHMELDLVVARASAVSVDPDMDVEGDEEQEMSMYCITCGHEIHARTAVRHMEKCFSKYESQSSFGSIYKTRIEGNNMFCDFYNVVNRTYCKRLRVLCPEHCKDPKVSDTEVCGCPLVTNVFDPTGEFCRMPKKSCVRHYCWEKLRRAEIDMERVRQWLKIDELLEQERQIRVGMASRAGLLALMLHSTYDHDLIEKMSKQPATDDVKT